MIHINVHSKSKQNAEISIVNTLGELVYVENIVVEDGLNSFQLSLIDIPVGVFDLHVRFTDETVKDIKFIHAAY